MDESFVYRWHDLKTGKYYVGKHKGRPDDGYIASSKYFLEEYYMRPEDFVRKIIKTGSDVEMFKYETKLLNRVNASENPKFYNKYNNIDKLYNDGSDEIKESQKTTWLKNYGVDNPSKSKAIRAKMSASAKSPATQNKKRNTMMRKYNVAHPTHHPEFIEKKQNTWERKYGVKEVLSRGTETRKKQDQTKLEKYGSTSILGLDFVIEKSKQSWIKKYGVDNPFKAESIKEKIRRTNLKKYGVENPAQSRLIQDKKIENMKIKANLPVEELIEIIKNNYQYYKKTRSGKLIVNSMIMRLLSFRETDDVEYILSRLKNYNESVL